MTQSSLRRLSIFMLAVLPIVGRVALGQLPTEIGKNHATVRSAWTPVVAQANRSVVRLFSGKRLEDVALGVIVSVDGYILSKASELKEAVECQLPSGRRIAARVVATDAPHDLVLLKVDARSLVPIQWVASRATESGVLVAVPGRGEMPLAVGIVGGAPQRVPPTEGVLGIVVRQTDLGPKITQVMPGSVAEKSGLLADDVVTHVGRRRVVVCRDLVGIVRQFDPGQIFALTILRGDRARTIKTGLDKQTVSPAPSGLDRDIIPSAARVPLSNRRGGFPEAFPHDAFLRPNDCGGPLINLQGEAIGLNIARADRTTSYALPARVVQEALKRMMPGV